MAVLKFFQNTVLLFCVGTVIFLSDAPSSAKDATTQDTKHTILELLHGNFLVPDIIPVAPDSSIKIFFGDTPVDFGTILPFSKVKHPPINITWPALKNALYTLILYGPDIGAPDILTRGWNHWLVVNIPGNKLKDGDVYTEYNSVDDDLYRLEGLYRLLFLVYKQPKNDTIPVPDKAIKGKIPIPDLSTSLLSISEFTKNHGFSKPTAANFFHVEGHQKIIED